MTLILRRKNIYMIRLKVSRPNAQVLMNILDVVINEIKVKTTTRTSTTIIVCIKIVLEVEMVIGRGRMIIRMTEVAYTFDLVVVMPN